MPAATADPRPVILLTTSTEARRDDLWREDTLTGRNYAEAVAAAGGLPLLAPTLAPDLAPDLARALVARADALLLTGGVDVDPYAFGEEPAAGLGRVDRDRDAFEFALYRAFRAAGKAVLGVCRGVQLVAVAEGGTLHQHLPAVPGMLQHAQRDRSGAPLQRVRLEPDSRLARAYGATELRVNSYHHQGVARVPPSLRAVARSGDGLVEALEAREGAPLVALQWHPEMSWRSFPEHLAPFRWLVDAARSAA